MSHSRKRQVTFYNGSKIVAEGNNLDIYRPYDTLVYHTSQRNIAETDTDYKRKVFAEWVFMRNRGRWEDEWDE